MSDVLLIPIRFALQLAAHLQSAARPQGLVEVPGVVDAVDRQQVHVVQPKITHRRFKRLAELPGGRLGHDLGLDDEFLPGELLQHGCQLHLGGAVAAGGLDVMDAQLDGPMDATARSRCHLWL